MYATNNEENVYLIGRFHSLTKQVTAIKVSKKYSFLIKFRLQVRTVLLKDTPNNSGKMLDCGLWERGQEINSVLSMHLGLKLIFQVIQSMENMKNFEQRYDMIWFA